MDPRENSYVPPGALPKPGWLGRGIRLVFGALLLESAYSIGTAFHPLVYAPAVPVNVVLWILVGVLFFSMREVIDLGLGVRWGQKAQLVTLGLAGLAIAADFIFFGRLWAPPLGILFWAWFLLIAIPLGVALVLAAFMGTPGCEMRTYAALIAKLQGRSAAEHYCPGGMDFVDRWEPHRGKS